MRQMLALSLACATALTLAACGDENGGTPTIDSGNPGGPDSSTPGPDAPIPPGSFTLAFPDVSVPSGQENTQCVVLRLGNPDMMRVNQIHNSLSGLSHHFLVYRTSDTVEQTVPFDCQPFTDTLDPSKGSPLMITQKADEILQLPPGVAFTLVPNQMIRLEMHFINTGDETAIASATATFSPIPDAEFMHEADFLFIGSPDIDLPPMQMTTLANQFFPLPSNLAASKFFGITGHEHKLGTNVTVEMGPSGGPFVDVYNVPGWFWDEPETVYHDPPFEIPAGGGFNFTCEWNNTTSQQVGFGESANQEMCFFWTYYYPSQGAFVCFHTTQFGPTLNVCCPGDAACAALGGP